MEKMEIVLTITRMIMEELDNVEIMKLKDCIKIKANTTDECAAIKTKNKIKSYFVERGFYIEFNECSLLLENEQGIKIKIKIFEWMDKYEIEWAILKIEVY
jgi:SOS response regulatory protein OraA/RecX